MPASRPCLSYEDVNRLVETRCVGPVPGSAVGIEAEWIVERAGGSGRAPALADILGALPGADALRSRISLEPGGQVELSSPPERLADACDTIARDRSVLGAALARSGIVLRAAGLGPGRDPARLVDSPRYAAMEAYFDRHGPYGRTMMRSTAALQINLDTGAPGDVERRWAVANEIGPTLAAAFANSPLGPDGPTGLRSTRLAVWLAIDPTRTACAHRRRVPASRAWTEYALAARVMFVRAPGPWPAPQRPLRFGTWMRLGHELGWPDADDFDYHLTTLFPPVRPRGRLELRMLDALPDPWWRAAVAVAAAVVNDADAGEAAAAAAAPTAHMWAEAARYGLSHPALARSARACFAAASAALDSLGCDPVTRAALDSFIDLYVARGRCPADDVLARWHAGTGRRNASVRLPEEEAWISRS